MPLDDISTNLHRSQSSRQHDTSRIDMENDNISHTKPAPIAIQSMLKNTTELGDVGIFATKPSRLPRSRTSASLDSRTRTSRSIQSQARRSREQQFEHDNPRIRSKYMSSPGRLRRSGTVRSNITAYQYQPYSRRPRARPGPLSYYHPPHSHRSLASLRCNNPAFNAYPPYNALSPHGPGQHLPRSASSSRSNVHEYHNPDVGCISRYNSHGPISRSPNSITSIGTGQQIHTTDLNALARIFRPSPSPAMGSSRSHLYNQHSISRSATPAMGMSRHQRFESMTSLRSLPTSPTGSIGPFYYDYSESFHGGETFLLATHPEHPTILETSTGNEDNVTPVIDAKTPFGTVPGSVFTPVELPTQHTRRSSEQSIKSRHSRKASSISMRSQLSLAIEMPADTVEGDNKHHLRYELEAKEPQVGSPSSVQDFLLTWPSLTLTPLVFSRGVSNGHRAATPHITFETGHRHPRA